MQMTKASGACILMFSATSETIFELILSKSSRDMPGLRGTWRRKTGTINGVSAETNQKRIFAKAAYACTPFACIHVNGQQQLTA